MAFQHPELLVPSIFAFFCALYPAPWHIRNRNIATLGMIFWMTDLNLVHIIDSESPSLLPQNLEETLADKQRYRLVR